MHSCTVLYPLEGPSSFSAVFMHLGSLRSSPHMGLLSRGMDILRQGDHLRMIVQSTEGCPRQSTGPPSETRDILAASGRNSSSSSSNSSSGRSRSRSRSSSSSSSSSGGSSSGDLEPNLGARLAYTDLAHLAFQDCFAGW